MSSTKYVFNIKSIKSIIEKDEFSVWCEMNNIDKDTNLLYNYLSIKKTQMIDNYIQYYKTNCNNCLEYNPKIYTNIKHELNSGYKLLNFSISDKHFIIDNVFLYKEKDITYIYILKTKKKFSYTDNIYFEYIYTFLHSYFGLIKLFIIPISVDILDRSTYKIINNSEYSNNHLSLVYTLINNIKDLIPGESIYPNMKSSNLTYYSFKKNIASKIDEITQYYYCTTTNRNYYIKSESRELSCSRLNINNKRKNIIDKILKNRNNIIKQDIVKYKSDFNTTKCVFIDFEYIPEVVYNCDNISDIKFISGIYNIGIYVDGVFYSYYTCDVLNEEKKLVYDFIKKIKEYSDKGYHIIHWTNAEINALYGFEKKYGLDLHINSINFYDLHAFFVKNDIYINTMKSYKLKDICNALMTTQNISLDTINNTIKHKGYDLKLYGKVPVKLESQKNSNDKITTGIETIGLYLLYSDSYQTFENIIFYNQLDCYYLSLLLNYFLDNN